MNILILDDCEIRHQLFKVHLDGAKVHQARTAREAIELLLLQSFDVLFLDHDLDMSGIMAGDGRDVVAEIEQAIKRGNYHSRDAMHCVHSFNDEYGPIMHRRLQAAGLKVSRCVGAWARHRDLDTLVTEENWTFPELEVGDVRPSGPPEDD